MQGVLRRLFEQEFKQYPALLKEIDTTLVFDIIRCQEDKALDAVSNAVKAELGWVFQDQFNETCQRRLTLPTSAFRVSSPS